ncbi:MAG: YgjV family protein [Streptococcus salivarius]
MTIYLLAQVFSAIGALCVAISSFAKSKHKMLVWQITDYIFTAIANLLLGGYTGALTISISIIRNSLMVKKKMTKAILTILIIIQIICRNPISISLGLIGYLPIISSVSYSLAIAITRNLQWLRWVIIENMLLWLIYDLTIQAYPAAVTDVTITLTTLVAIIKNRKTFSR